MAKSIQLSFCTSTFASLRCQVSLIGSNRGLQTLDLRLRLVVSMLGRSELVILFGEPALLLGECSLLFLVKSFETLDLRLRLVISILG